MNLKSIKVNYFYNIILTLSNLLFPMLTFPFVARIIGPEGLGKVGFAANLAAYFITFAQVGIPVYGIREISKNRDNEEKRSKVFSELLIINAITVLIAFTIYGILFIFNSKMQSDQVLYFVAGITIFISMFSIDWVYSGLEEYKYIAIRSLLVRTIVVALIFSFIREKDDYLVYAIITAVGVIINNILNLIAAKGKVKLTFKNLNILRHRKALFALTSASIIGSIYTYMDVMLLGVIGSDIHVGYYTTSKKITGLAVAIIGSLGTVLIPRLSFYVDKKMNKEYTYLIQRSLNFIFFLAFPAIVYILIMAEEILLFFGGPEFIEAQMSLRLISLQLLFTSLATFFGFQVIIPHNDEKSIVKANLFGAISNIIINIIFIRYFYHNTASFAIMFSEMIVTVSLIILSKNYTSFKLFDSNSLVYLKGSILFGSVIFFAKLIISNNYLITILITGLLSIIIYIAYLTIKREEFIMMFLKSLKRRIK